MPDERKMEDQRRKEIIEIWKTVVEVQRHFNDISMRIRSMFITILLALFAAIGLLLNKNLDLEIAGYQVQYAILVPLFGIFGTLLFYFMDRYWYHRLLVGSVKHAIDIERKYKSEIPELSLSDAIGAESPYEPKGFFMRSLAKLLVRHDKYRETGELHSDGKIELFYKSVVLVLIMTMIMLAFFGGIVADKKIRTALEAPETTTAPAAPVQAAPAKSPTTSPPAADKTE